MDPKQLDEQRLSTLTAMRAAFSEGRFADVLSAFAELGETKTIRSGIRVEAIALAARAHTALDAKTPARQLLKQIWSGALKHHRHCRHVAIACLELGEYRRAAAMSERAAELVDSGKGDLSAV